jgi:PKD repeat protein
MIRRLLLLAMLAGACGLFAFDIDFTAQPDSGGVPLTVSFTSTITGIDPGDVVSYDWDFGDGGDSDQANPSYVYVHAGVYDVSLHVVGIENGNQHTENLNKNDYIYVAGMDVALIVDCSSSMNGPKLQNAQNGALQFMNLLNDGDEVGATAYSLHTEFFCPIQTTPQDGDAAAMINGITPCTYTAMGWGLYAGYVILSSAMDFDLPVAMIVLSDGLDDATPLGTQIVSQLPPTSQMRVYTIGYGADMSASMLQQIANARPGGFTNGNTGNVTQALQNIYTLHAGAERAGYFEGDLGSGRETVYEFPIDGSYLTGVFNLTWTHPEAEFDAELVSPRGVSVPLTGLLRHDVRTQLLLKTDRPEPGTWRVVIRNVSDRKLTEHFFFNMFGYSSLKMDCSFDNETYNLGDPLGMNISLYDDGQPIRNATVTMTVLGPDGQTWQLPCLWSESVQGYQAQFDQGFVDGAYKFQIVAETLGEGAGEIRRIVQLCHHIGAPYEQRVIADDSAVAAPKTDLIISPNPFNPTASISFSLPAEGRTTLQVYNLRGELVRTLIDDQMTAGDHVIQWNGQTEDNRPAASGLYLFRLKSGQLTSTGKAILLK